MPGEPEGAALVRAGTGDLPVLALVAGAAMATRPFGRWVRWPLALLSWPCWLLVLWLSTPYVWRMGHRAAVTIRPPDAPQRPASGRVLGVLTALLLVEALGQELLPHDWVVWALLVVVLAFVLVDLAPYPGRLWRAGPDVVHSAHAVTITTAVSLRHGSGVLAATGRVIDSTWPDAPVEAVARSEDLVPVYARVWRLEQVEPGRGRMVRRRTCPLPCDQDAAAAVTDPHAGTTTNRSVLHPGA